MISHAFYGIDEISDFIEVALRMDLVVDECGHRAVALKKAFFRFVMGTQFLHWDAEDSGGGGRKGQRFHLRESVDTRMCTDFQGLFGSRP